MNTDFYRSIYLAHIFDWTEPVHSRLNWLFVTLDSSRNLWATGHNSASGLKTNGISFEYAPEGLWLFSSDVVKPYVRDSFARPFSACYIFDKHVRKCAVPTFDQTTDSGTSFDKSEIDLVAPEIKRLNAIGYAADGVGVQLVCLDDEISHFVRQGFESWWEANEK